jgi:hypothetical protein
MARVVGIADGANITQASVDSLTFNLYQKRTTAAALQSYSLVVAKVVFDALQTDDRWTVDSTGYNVGYLLPNYYMAEPYEYRAEIVITSVTTLSETNAAGTAAGGGDDFILLEDDAPQSDDYPNGDGILLTGGTGSGQERRIIDYQDTGHGSGECYAQVDSAWDTNPDATTTYIIGAGRYPIVWDLHAVSLRSS